MASKVFFAIIGICLTCTLILFDVSNRASKVEIIFLKPDSEAIGDLGTTGSNETYSTFNEKNNQKRVTFNINWSKMIRGVRDAVTRLNFEFSNSKDSIHANDVKISVPPAYRVNRNTMSIAGNITVGEQVPSNFVRKIIIATTWRSGSSFLGELINQYPGTFYYFEPLHYYSNLKDRKNVPTETDFFKSLLSCQFGEKNEGFLKHVKMKQNAFLFQRHNLRLWNSCKLLKPKEELCFSKEYLSMLCPLYPIRLLKTVRLRVQKMEELLRNEDNIWIVVLVRDPRAVFNSRRSKTISRWCVNKHCSDPKVSCKDLSDDITAAFELQKKYPEKVTLIRFEDLSLNPKQSVKRLYSFLKLPSHKATDNFIDSHTGKDVKKRQKSSNKFVQVKDPYGTVRNSTATVSAWMKSLSFPDVLQIQSACKEPMTHLGYRMMTSEDDMKGQDEIMDKTADQVWPFS